MSSRERFRSERSNNESDEESHDNNNSSAVLDDFGREVSGNNPVQRDATVASSADRSPNAAERSNSPSSRKAKSRSVSPPPRRRDRSRSPRRSRSRSPRGYGRRRSPPPRGGGAEWGAEFGGNAYRGGGGHERHGYQQQQHGSYRSRGRGNGGGGRGRHSWGAGGGGYQQRGRTARRPDTHRSSHGGRGGAYDQSRPYANAGDRSSYRSEPPRPSLRTFQQFLVTQESTIEPSEAQRRYEVYKKQFVEKATRAFFDEHKENQWFREKYHPVESKPEHDRWLERTRAAATTFAQELTEGELKWHLDVSHSSNKVYRPFEKHVNASVRTAAELVPTAIDDADQQLAALAAADATGRAIEDLSESGDADKDDNDEDDEAAAAALAAARASLTRDSERRSVFVKSVPPRASREAVEAVFRGVPGFEKLTLSDPSPARRMCRFGWVTYDTRPHAIRALEQLGNFPLELPGGGTFRLMLKLNVPQRVRVPIVPPAFSLPSRLEHDREQARRLALRLDTDAGLSHADSTHPLFDWPQYNELSSEDQLDLIIGYLRRVHLYAYYSGDKFERADQLERHHGPVQLRYNSEHAQTLLSGKKKGVTPSNAEPEEGEAEAGEVATSDMAEDNNTTTDNDISNTDNNNNNNNNNNDDGNDDDDDDADPLANIPEADRTLLAKVDSCAQALIDAPPVDLVERFEAKSLVDSALATFVKKNSQALADDKHKCSICPKKVFRGFEFLEKHLLNKHPKEVDAVKESAYLEQSLANFLADPRRIHPEEPIQSKHNNRQNDQRRNSGRGRGGGAGGNYRHNTFQAPLMAPVAAPPPRGVPGARPLRSYQDLDAPKGPSSRIDYGFDSD